MNTEEDVIVDSSPEEVIENDSEVEKTPEESVPETGKTVPYERFKEVNDELAKLKKQPKSAVKQDKSPVDALDFIKLGKKLQDYSDEEIDFATEYAKSKEPNAIMQALENEYIQLAFEAKRQKVDKEKSLTPSGKQSEMEKPKSFMDKLRSADLSSAEKMLEEAGLYKSPRPNPNRKNIG